MSSSIYENQGTFSRGKNRNMHYAGMIDRGIERKRGKRGKALLGAGQRREETIARARV